VQTIEENTESLRVVAAARESATQTSIQIGIRKPKPVTTPEPEGQPKPRSRRQRKNDNRKLKLKAAINECQLKGIDSPIVRQHLNRRAEHNERRCIRQHKAGLAKAKEAAEADEHNKQRFTSSKEVTNARQHNPLRIEARHHQHLADLNAHTALRCRNSVRDLSSGVPNFFDITGKDTKSTALPYNTTQYKHHLCYRQ
jgi:hypothetical protein